MHSSLLLLFLSTGVHSHNQGFVGSIFPILISSFFANVFDIVQVLKYLVRRENFDF